MLRAGGFFDVRPRFAVLLHALLGYMRNTRSDCHGGNCVWNNFIVVSNAQQAAECSELFARPQRRAVCPSVHNTPVSSCNDDLHQQCALVVGGAGNVTGGQEINQLGCCL